MTKGEIKEAAEVVLIARKDIDRYIYAVLRNEKCVLRARGLNVKKAIDVALISQRDYGYEVESTAIYDEVLKTEDNTERHISAIDIALHK
jgi:DNA-binding protein Alba